MHVTNGDQKIIAELLVCLDQFCELESNPLLRKQDHLPSVLAETRRCIYIAHKTLESFATRSLYFGVIEQLLQQIGQIGLCIPENEMHQNNAVLAWWLMKTQVVQRANRYLWQTAEDRMQLLNAGRLLLEQKFGGVTSEKTASPNQETLIVIKDVQRFCDFSLKYIDAAGAMNCRDLLKRRAAGGTWAREWYLDEYCSDVNDMSEDGLLATATHRAINAVDWKLVTGYLNSLLEQEQVKSLTY